MARKSHSATAGPCDPLTPVSVGGHARVWFLKSRGLESRWVLDFLKAPSGADPKNGRDEGQTNGRDASVQTISPCEKRFLDDPLVRYR